MDGQGGKHRKVGVTGISRQAGRGSEGPAQPVQRAGSALWLWFILNVVRAVLAEEGQLGEVRRGCGAI